MTLVVSLIKTRQSDNERQPTTQDKEYERQVMFLCSKAIQRGPRANLARLRYVLVFAFESGQTANLERVGSILLFANQSGPRAILERLGCVLLFANQGGPRANLKRLGCVRMFATKSRPKGNICVGFFFRRTRGNFLQMKTCLLYTSPSPRD